MPRSNSGPRCIALVGPFQSGKTTLLEAILAQTGATQRMGSVETGTTVGDVAEGKAINIALAATSRRSTHPRRPSAIRSARSARLSPS